MHKDEKILKKIGFTLSIAIERAAIYGRAKQFEFSHLQGAEPI